MTGPTWKEILGNARVIESLARIAKSPTLGHAYLFCGPEGVGKLLAGLAFARAANCTCGETAGLCDSCSSLDVLNHPEVLVLCDANKPRWIKRQDLLGRLGLAGPDARQRYAETVLSVFEKKYLEEPLPRVEDEAVFDGFNIATDQLFGQGSGPSKECYTPGPASEAIRKEFDRGDLSEAEFSLLRELYEYPLSVMPYRGAIPIAYVTARKDWKATRPIQALLSVRSILGGKKVVIIDDAHKMTPQAQNCLLKTLEEPPPDSLLVLVTSEREGLFSTIVSRCQVVSFERLTAAEMNLAAGALVGDAGKHLGLVAALSENCPGKLLELAGAEIVGKVGAVSDFFTAVADGRLENVFAVSGVVLGDAAAHRKKLQYAVRQTFELAIFWITEILRAKHGIAGRLESSEYAGALQAHAVRFGEAALLDAAERLEKGIALAYTNVDIGLLLHTTLLRTAQALGVLTPKRA